MLRLPRARRCTSTGDPKEHPFAGDPSHWLNPGVLGEHRLWGASFDFFVDWTGWVPAPARAEARRRKKPTSAVPRFVPGAWVKLIVDPPTTEFPELGRARIQEAIEACVGQQQLRRMASLTRSLGWPLRYLLFPDVDWKAFPETPILAVQIGEGGAITAEDCVDLDVLRKIIRRNSGGATRVGLKGMKFTTSTLECFLSDTDSPWPGDADLLLVENDTPRVLIENKKSTFRSEIWRQGLGNYHPHPDDRKYARLLALSQSLRKDLPVVVVYYPTEPTIQEVKLERIGIGAVGEICTLYTDIVPLPGKTDEDSHRRFLESVLQIAGR